MQVIFSFMLFFVFGCVSVTSAERLVTALWEATGDTLQLDSVRYTTVSSVEDVSPKPYLHNNSIFNPLSIYLSYSIFTYDGRTIKQGRIQPHSNEALSMEDGLYFIQIGSELYKSSLYKNRISRGLRVISSVDDSVAIAYKTGYKNKPIIIESNQSELLFEMERDSTLDYHTIKNITLYLDLDSCIVSYAKHYYYDPMIFIPNTEYYNQSINYNIDVSDFTEQYSSNIFDGNSFSFSSKTQYGSSYGDRKYSFSISKDIITSYRYSHVFGYSNALRDSYHYEDIAILDSLQLNRVTKNSIIYEYKRDPNEIPYVKDVNNDVWNGYYERQRFDSILSPEKIKIMLVFSNR